MAKTTIIFSDGDEGGIQLTAEFDPPVSSDDDASPAQSEAARFLNMFQDSLEADDGITIRDTDEAWDDEAENNEESEEN